MNVNKIFPTQFNSLPRVGCPINSCDETVHIKGTIFGTNIPATSTSGPGLIIEFECEHGHKWHTVFEDHSGGLWINHVRVK